MGLLRGMLHCQHEDGQVLIFMLMIDGSQGEGGGQVLRTSLSLAALTGRPFRLTNIRAARKKPGLRPQHLTAVHAVAAVCNARMAGAEINSTALEFQPQTASRGGAYQFDVATYAQGGSAGSATLIFQALIWPLLFADAPTVVTLQGGTHVPYSPPFHYLAHVAQPVFTRLGAEITLNLDAWGWYPQGGGAITAHIKPLTKLHAADFQRAPVEQVEGIAAVTNLPAHIAQRMARRAANLLQKQAISTNIQPVRARGSAPGAGIFLWVPGGGFSCLGRKGLPAEKVSETAVAQCVAFIENNASVDKYLADQLLLPLALAHGASCFTTGEITLHTLTNANLLRQWLGVTIQIQGRQGQPGQIIVHGMHYV